jgi:hypothetical protein
MDLNISQLIYEQHYKAHMSFEAFADLLRKGLRVDGNGATAGPSNEPDSASRIAMEYNIELMVKHLQD